MNNLPERDPAAELTPEEQVQVNKAGAPHEIDFVVKVRELSLEQATSVTKWLLASLLAINGGGALATLNAVDKVDNPTLPASLFVLGMLLCLSSALIIQNTNYALMPHFNRLIGYWLSVAEDGERVESLEADMGKAFKPPIWKRWQSPLLGWVSALCFVAGVWALGNSLVEHRAATTLPAPPTAAILSPTRSASR